MAMTENDWKSIEEAVARMTAGERQLLLATVARTLANEPTAEVLSDQQRTLQSLLVEMEQLSVMLPGDGFSNRNHDRLLYGDRR